MFEHAQDEYFSIIQRLGASPWLDIGCGWHLLWPWQLEEEQCLVHDKFIVGVDPDREALGKHRTIRKRVCAEGGNLPFRDNFFALTTANVMIEHVTHPEVFLREIWRTTQPGGMFLFHTVNSWGYLGIGTRLVPNRFHAKVLRLISPNRAESDVYPTQYRLNTNSAIRRCARQTGWEIRSLSFLTTVPAFQRGLPWLVESLWIRMLRTRIFRRLRTNLIAILVKPGGGSAA